LRLLALNLENFRNVESASLSFEGDRIFLLGPNGQGKTNLLEAIGLSSNLRSFRKSGFDGLVRDGQEQSRLFCRFLNDSGEESEVLLTFRTKGDKHLEVDGEKVSKLGDFLGEFPSVALSSRDLRLIRDGPAERRRWLDLLLSTSSPDYFSTVQSFHRALRERNALLKQDGGDKELDAFEQALIPSAVRLRAMRADALPALSASLAETCTVLSGGKEDAGVDYRPDLPLENEDEYRTRLLSDRARDRIIGSTRRGPHRDDFRFLINSRDARTYASEGQQRGLVLALRLAEFSYLSDTCKRVPILLADDVLVELDSARKANFEKLLPPTAQVFASGTSFPPSDERERWETFGVSSGAFSKS
jgi:DNA replication and repair protein RecF